MTLEREYVDQKPNGEVTKFMAVTELTRFDRVITFKNAKAFCFSRDPRPKKIGSVTALPWEKGLEDVGL